MEPEKRPDRGWAETLTGLTRRTTLKAGAVAAGALATVGAATGKEHEDDEDSEGQTEDGGQVDEPAGFEATVLAPHATFPDNVAVEFTVEDSAYGEEEVAMLEDASTVIFAEITLEPGGTSGWHTHPGPVLVNVREGELEITSDERCEPTSYAAGEAFVDPGTHNEEAANPSDEEETVALAAFMGVPDGEEPTEWVEPADC